MNVGTLQLDWNYFLDKIESEQCVIVLGPQAFLNEDNTPYQDNLIEHLDIPNNPNVYRYYPDEGFFLFDDLYKRTLICHQIKSYYKDLAPPAIVSKLMEIPFHVILTVTPDLFLTQTADKQGFEYQFGYYKKNQNPQSIKNPSRELPLIYNVFGCVNYEESIILTHDDLYDYFKSIFVRKSMPDKLKALLADVRNFIFLGIPFEKWYMQLLMRELEIHKQQYQFTRFAANQVSSDEVKTFCFEQFKINFVANDITSFIEEAHKRCKERGILRMAGEKAETEAGRIRNYISMGDYDEAIDLLEELVEDTELEDESNKLAGRYRKFKKRVMNNVLYEDQREVQEAKIVSLILDLVKMAEKANII